MENGGAVFFFSQSNGTAWFDRCEKPFLFSLSLESTALICF